MADKTAEPKRWVLVKMLHAAVERTEAEIAELKAHLLFVRDASGPEDHQEDPEPEPQPGAPAAAAPRTAATTPAGNPPPGGTTPKE